MRDDANFHTSSKLYGDTCDELYYKDRSNFLEEAAKVRHRAPRFSPYDIIEIFNSNIDVNSERFNEILNLKFQTESGELRPLLHYPSDIVEYYNSDIKDLKIIEKLVPLTYHSDGEERLMFSAPKK